MNIPFLKQRLLPFCLLALALLGAGAPLRAQRPPPSTGERVLRLEQVEITGAGKTRPTLIAALLALEPGDPVDPAGLVAAKRRLLDTGYFHSVQLSTRPGSARGRVVVVINVVERHRPYFDTGFGFRDPEGWYLTLLGLRSENPLGRGGRASAGLRLGFRTWGAEAELRMPLTVDRRLDLRLRLRAYEEQTLWYEEELGWSGLYDAT